MDLERYNRHIILPEIGVDGQSKLNKAKVLVVGAGGLGSPVLTYLAASGVGTIGIVDDDVVSRSNLQRQILYKTSEIGQVKAEKAKERLLENNPEVSIEIFNTRLSAANATAIAEKYEIIVDCTDNYDSRYIIDKVSVDLKIPMVYGSISKFAGQVAVFNYNGSKSYRDLFDEKPEIDESDPSRLGVLGVLPGIIGAIQANEVLKIILELSGVLANTLFLVDSKTMETKRINF
ncbi:ThiF family adenylyltransferase [Mangrovibacterium sp.]|uniref:HesA/MoeB/ThiF family protein n=1 Tax=Mangrovibacterium sp. TaxID=1961364 RepID=UPI003564C27E